MRDEDLAIRSRALSPQGSVQRQHRLDQGCHRIDEEPDLRGQVQPARVDKESTRSTRSSGDVCFSPASYALLCTSFSDFFHRRSETTNPSPTH